MELFGNDSKSERESRKPLADRIRPKTLDEVVGQEHLLGKGKILRVLLDKKDVPSLIFWGPERCWKNDPRLAYRETHESSLCLSKCSKYWH